MPRKFGFANLKKRRSIGQPVFGVRGVSKMSLYALFHITIRVGTTALMGGGLSSYYKGFPNVHSALS